MYRLSVAFFGMVHLFAQQSKPQDPALAAYRAWISAHPPVEQDSERKSRDQSLLTATAEWVRHWPDSKLAWQQRLEVLRSLHSDSESEWRATGEAIIRLSPPHTEDRRVASDWINAGVLLKPAITLLRSELARHVKKAAVVAETDRGTLSALVEQSANAMERFDLLQLLASASIKLGRFAEARQALSDLDQFLITDFPDNIDPDPFDTVPDYQSRFWILSGDLALAEGRKIDGLGFYARVVGDPYYRRMYPGGYLEQTRSLWNQLGGTADTWTTLAKPLPLPRDLANVPPYLPMFPWRSLNFALPALKAGDLRSSDAKPDNDSSVWRGKTTFVAIWATWCVPCWSELPGIQMLSGLLSANSDLQMVTLSVDDDPAKVADFMRTKGYTFPVIVNPAYVKQIVPKLILGERWVVDRNGAVRLWNVPWSFRGQDRAFADVAIYKLNRIAKEPSR